MFKIVESIDKQTLDNQDIQYNSKEPQFTS